MNGNSEKQKVNGKCEFLSEGEDCENCKKPIPVGQPVYFVTLDYWEDEGCYCCRLCWEYEFE